MKKHEASHHTKVEAWVRHHLKEQPRINLKVELKHTRGASSLPYTALEPHQLDDLLSFAHGFPFVHKFDDVGYREKPCDIIGVAGGLSLLAISYPDAIILISIFVWMQEEKDSKRRSLPRERARALAYDIIKL